MGWLPPLSLWAAAKPPFLQNIGALGGGSPPAWKGFGGRPQAERGNVDESGSLVANVVPITPIRTSRFAHLDLEGSGDREPRFLINPEGCKIVLTSRFKKVQAYSNVSRPLLSRFGHFSGSRRTVTSGQGFDKIQRCLHAEARSFASPKCRIVTFPMVCESHADYD